MTSFVVAGQLTGSAEWHARLHPGYARTTRRAIPPKISSPPASRAKTFEATAAKAIRSLAEQSSWQLALLRIQTLWEEGRKPDARVYSAGMTACAYSKKWQQAIALVADMAQRMVRTSVV
eukprot:4183076-Amphidinium_carterae.1